MKTPNIDTLVNQLQQRDAALGDGSDVLLTPRAQAEFHATKQELARTITGLRNPDLDKPLALLADVETKRAAVVAKEAEIVQQLNAAPDWRSLRDGRERDREYDRQQHLKQQLHMLRTGTLLKAPGVVYEPLDYLDARIAELTTKIATLRERLDAHVEQAKALLAAGTVPR